MNIKNNLIKIARILFYPFSYYLYYKLFRHKLEVSRQGGKLKSGITAVVAAKNEDYTISFCLKSLIGIVDQIVCIDNGSEDNTLQKMHDFKNEFRKHVEVEIISMPNALLGDCREAGLNATKYQWHLRWDADMICKTSGNEDMKQLREKILKINYPCTIQLPRIHLMGDLHHTLRIEAVIDQGEPILVRFSKNIFYKEYGKFDSIKVPYWYKQLKESKNYYFHLNGLKSDTNLIHRFHYFSWRSAINNAKTKEEQSNLLNFEKYKYDRNIELFGTNDNCSLKFRFQRQYSYNYKKFDCKKYGEYPKILIEEMDLDKERFKIIYKDQKPYLRIDKEDSEMVSYQPTDEDLKWDPEEFLKKFYRDKEYKN